MVFALSRVKSFFLVCIHFSGQASHSVVILLVYNGNKSSKVSGQISQGRTSQKTNEPGGE